MANGIFLITIAVGINSSSSASLIVVLFVVLLILLLLFIVVALETEGSMFAMLEFPTIIVSVVVIIVTVIVIVITNHGNINFLALSLVSLILV